MEEAFTRTWSVFTLHSVSAFKLKYCEPFGTINALFQRLHLFWPFLIYFKINVGKVAHFLLTIHPDHTDFSGSRHYDGQDSKCRDNDWKPLLRIYMGGRIFQPNTHSRGVIIPLVYSVGNDCIYR